MDAGGAAAAGEAGPLRRRPVSGVSADPLELVAHARTDADGRGMARSGHTERYRYGHARRRGADRRDDVCRPAGPPAYLGGLALTDLHRRHHRPAPRRVRVRALFRGPATAAPAHL